MGERPSFFSLLGAIHVLAPIPFKCLPKKNYNPCEKQGPHCLPEEMNHGYAWFNSLATMPVPQRPLFENPLDKLGPLDHGVGNCLNHSCSGVGEGEI